MDDVRAVMDAAGSKRAALFGISEGGPMSILFAATYPERTSALILYGSIARGSWAPNYPWGPRPGEQWEAWLEGWRTEWGGPMPFRPGHHRSTETSGSGSGGRNICVSAQAPAPSSVSSA